METNKPDLQPTGRARAQPGQLNCGMNALSARQRTDWHVRAGKRPGLGKGSSEVVIEQCLQLTNQGGQTQRLGDWVEHSQVLYDCGSDQPGTEHVWEQEPITKARPRTDKGWNQQRVA